MWATLNGVDTSLCAPYTGSGARAGAAPGTRTATSPARIRPVRARRAGRRERREGTCTGESSVTPGGEMTDSGPRYRVVSNGVIDVSDQCPGRSFGAGRSSRRARAVVPGGVRLSDDVVQPPHRGALARVPERLELVVPGLAEELVDLQQHRGVAQRRLHHGGLE